MRPADVFLEHLSWPQVQAALEHGYRTVIVPCGAVEQHGPHLPLFVDAEHGTRLGREVADRLGNALVAPTIRIGCSEHHMDFPGTISLEVTTFRAVCRDYCKSLSRHGFTTVCFLPTHGGNFKPLTDMLSELGAAVPPECTVLAFTDLIAFIETWRDVVRQEAELAERVGGHADIAESSIMLTLHPDLVDVQKAEAGFQPELDGDVIAKIIREGFKSVTSNGILGDARGMSKRIGNRCISELADVVAGYFASHRSPSASS